MATNHLNVHSTLNNVIERDNLKKIKVNFEFKIRLFCVHVIIPSHYMRGILNVIVSDSIL